jgi:galactose mutarotase-like enzyme
LELLTQQETLRNDIMTTTISNKHFTAGIKHKGAELFSLVRNDLKMEYIWEANPVYWAKTSPVLFPIVGELRNGEYFFKGESYTLPRHGFARVMEFERQFFEGDKAGFLLKSNEKTHSNYPFPFELRITYALDRDHLSVQYTVTNPSEAIMYFSLGAHPAFKIPLVSGTDYSDYYIHFNKKETAPRWLISADGLIENQSLPLLNDTNRLDLTKELFYEDALVFKNLQSDTLSIRSDKNSHGLDFTFEGFPYFGIWAYKNADFVCLEPWCGIADSVDHNRQLDLKEGIVKLGARSEWSRSWQVKCY